MKRALTFVLTGLGAMACCAQAWALSSASTGIKANIVRPAGIDVVSSLMLPSFTNTTVNAASAYTAGATGSTNGGASNGSNATLTIHGQSGDAVSMAVPESFTVVRTGGTEALTVKTNTNAEYGVAQNNVVLGGSVMGGSTMSVNVGGAISLASSGGATPGDYEGLLVVVVQYN